MSALVPLLVATGAQDGFFGVRALWQSARSIAAEHPADSEAAFDQAIAASPGNNGLLLSAAGAALRAHDPARARLLLTRLAVQGGTVTEENEAAIAAELAAPASDPLLVSLTANRTPVARGTPWATLPATIRLIEGVAYDDRRQAAYVSSVVDRTLYRIDGKGAVSVALKLPPDFGSPLALAIDPRHRLLWAALDPKAPGGSGAGGLLRLSLDTGDRALLPGPAGEALSIGDVAVGADGTAFAADGRSGGVYRCRPGCKALETLLAPGVLRSAQGMVTSPDGKRLYVADYAYGIAIVDLATGATQPLATAPGVAIDGLDGLVWRDGRIVAIQNGWQPARMIAIDLDRAGTTAMAARVIARAGPMTDPTQVARLAGGALLVVANAQWDRYENVTAPREVAQEPTVLLRLPAQ
uniref:SMP-30/gluconolactonase/LRE family protein n=1 Tax=Sphingomonas bacterium TaxID=1895847 RepID=UPI002602A735|nr:hypothetical protein [Sphingomonas bacterium]